MLVEDICLRLVVIIDDQEVIRNSLRAFLETEGLAVIEFASAETFLAGPLPALVGCLLVDINMPGMNGLALQEELNRRNVHIPLIVMTGQADVARAVRAMKAGAADFLEKPFDDATLLAAIRRALADGRRMESSAEEIRRASLLFQDLTNREREVLGRLTLGEPNKAVGFHLGISPRTVEVHRSRLQRKLKAHSLPELVRIARLAGQLT
jgi:two-component system, LuxR family, response regulator FixJ